MKIVKILVVILFFGSCSKGHIIHVARIEDLKEAFNMKFSSLKDFEFVYNGITLVANDTVIQSEEDDNIQWAARVYKGGHSTCFILEQFQSNTDSIKLVAILSPQLKTENKIGINSFFRSVKDRIDYASWMKYPDGYTMFNDNTDSTIVYSFNLNSNLDSNRKKIIEGKIEPKTRIDKVILYR